MTIILRAALACVLGLLGAQAYVVAVLGLMGVLIAWWTIPVVAGVLAALAYYWLATRHADWFR